MEINKSEYGVTKEGLPPYVQNALDTVAKNEGFINYKIDIAPGSSVGDGFVAVIVKATINGVRNVCERPNVSTTDQLIVIAKIPPLNTVRRELIGMLAFEREVFVYNNVIPAIIKFQNEKGITTTTDNGFFSFPKCYLAYFDKEKDEAIIIMDDIREHGYQMEDKYKPVGFEQAKILLDNLGQYHAISFAMKDQCPVEFSKLTQNLKDILSDMMGTDMMTNMNTLNMERAIKSLQPNEQLIKNKLLEFQVKLNSETKNCTNGALAEPYAIINHGDAWINNMMFKYENGVPKYLCLLDWQLCRYASPILDIIYFIFLGSDKELRDKHFDTLLKSYHKSLSDHLKRLGSDVNKMFPYTALLDQLKMFGKFGIIMALFVIPMLCLPNTELPDMDKMAEDFQKGASVEEVGTLFKVTGDTENKYNIRISDIIRDAVKMNLI